MNPNETPVAVDELHAFVDGQLEPGRFPAVLAWLQEHPEQALQVAQWQAQRRALRRLHRESDPGPTPPALAAVVQPAPAGGRRWPAWAQAAVLAGVLVLGVAGGRFWPGADGAGAAGAAAASAASSLAGAPGFVHEARVAHAVFTPEKRHPVEVGASAAADEAHLVQWLSRRLGSPLRTPDLTAEGFRLLGGRLLPGQPVPRAQFMYEDTAGRRVTLYIAVFEPGQAPADVGFRSGREGDSETFYWLEGPFGYALSAPIAAGDLQRLARTVYTQLATK